MTEHLTAVFAIDPGPTQSAYVIWDGVKVRGHEIVDNESLCDEFYAADFRRERAQLVIEGVACYGMPVGKEVFDTCISIGRFMESYGNAPADLVYRKDVKQHLCGSARAKDANIRQALIDRFGGKDKAIGKKAKPGPLYGIKSHCWSALAVAVTWWDQHNKERATA